jgi:hypothetical protein
MKKIPLRYLPKSLSERDRKKQINSLKKSKKMYKSHKYYQRPKIGSFFSKTSKHVRNAQKIYGIDKITPGEELAKKSGCSVSALRKIVNKGEGAYYSSGSRPNQTARSWGLARLASALTGGKSAAVDYNIIENGCKHTGKAYRMANMAKKKYGYGHGKTKKVIIKGGAEDDVINDSILCDHENNCYTGQLKNNMKNGEGEMRYNNGDIYVGNWKNDMKNGQGIMKYNNGDYYDGYWKSDMKYDYGEMKYNNEDYYRGNWKDDKKHGKNGYMRYKNGDFYVGYWENDMKNGFGKMTNITGYIHINNRYSYLGNWKDDKKHGYGIMIYGQGNAYKEKWDNGELKEFIKIEKKDIQYIRNEILNLNLNKPLKSINKKPSINKKQSNKKQSNKKQSNKKPSIIKSAPNTIQLSGTCVAHSISRSITRTFLLLTLIDGNKSEEMFTALYCYYLKFAKEELLKEEISRRYSILYPDPKFSPLPLSHPDNPLQKQIFDIQSIITQELKQPKEEPQEKPQENPQEESKQELPIKSTSQKKFTFKPIMLRNILRKRKGGLRIDEINKNICENSGRIRFYELFMNKIKDNISGLFECKYDEIPCDYIVGGCRLHKNNNYILSFSNDEKNTFLNKFKKLKQYISFKEIEYNYKINEINLPPLEIKNALNKKIQPIISMKCRGTENTGHSFILRSWGKEYDNNGNEITVKKNRFCYKNTWVNDSNGCVDDINELCDNLYSDTNEIKPVTNIKFYYLDFNLDEIQKHDNELYTNIKDRIDIIYNSTYNDDE